ncbi:26S proteasome regulatory subunit rpn12 [Schizosaccharomyces pombe]|uniref:26S proteasome regulatory subunit rpn12 n=1 Tax=Schizosaccharomyces pombe (strain 972 / ATCC 24843) TaxID=284812 RepID=RPN12_SCHPO|nr:19S proteasome regulatory subunit Rpn12 [Schizosaccharomyces pombe]P50524.1 RecName: Full=26S proteasome regulatory subunit rpn12 [Schizosaccharomyces pombe 972h-]CAA63366.1 26S protease regulatory subunit [Schizosaccharomyces pombe]CAB46777.2 19S proteasome regulatory subunit Rpn12 [Schizosaccharomyces pombe]prf//2210317A 26S protease subunit [Schizosaccharomyces pombe]|eukprot:NP_596750.2 19S proteasome regulatory subunit Rpn12 [Schizosaccharomyces pombe]
MSTLDLNHLADLYDRKDWNACKKELLKLKVELAKQNLFVPTSDKEKASFARNVFEYGVLVSIQTCDIESFARYASQVIPFYHDSLVPSSRMGLVTGLNLLYLLSENRIAEFHTALESVPDKSLFERDPYVEWVISLEQNVMEGAFDKVASMIRSCNFPEFSYFMKIVMSMVRNEIATCAEKVYSEIPLSNATSLLYLENTKETEKLAEERGWDIRDGVIYFPKEANALETEDGMLIDEEDELELPPTASKHTISSIRQLLSYTSELEQIV